MNLSELEIIEKYAKQCNHCARNTLLPYEYEFTCVSCGYNTIKGKHELSEKQRKKIIFLNGLKYAEKNVFCISVDLCQIYDGMEYNKIFEVLSTQKNKELKRNNILI